MIRTVDTVSTSALNVNYNMMGMQFLPVTWGGYAKISRAHSYGIKVDDPITNDSEYTSPISLMEKSSLPIFSAADRTIFFTATVNITQENISTEEENFFLKPPST